MECSTPYGTVVPKTESAEARPTPRSASLLGVVAAGDVGWAQLGPYLVIVAELPLGPETLERLKTALDEVAVYVAEEPPDHS